MVKNPQGTVYSGPGDRTMNDVLRGVRQGIFPQKLVIKPKETQILANLPIPLQAPASNNRTTMMRLASSSPVYLANLVKKLKILAGGKRQVQVDFLYLPDSTPPQHLTVRTEG